MTVSAGTCPYYSASDTYAATQNYTTCAMYACGEYEVSVSVCDSYGGDTYLVLVDALGNELASNDDSCGVGSAFTVQIPPSYGCGTFYIREGCWDTDACSGIVSYTGGTPATGTYHVGILLLYVTLYVRFVVNLNM